MSYTSFFHQQDSGNMVIPNATFKKPKNFDDRLADVTRRIEALNMRARNPSMGATPGGYQQQSNNYY